MAHDWRDLVPVCDGAYLFQGALYCEDCGERIIEEMKRAGQEDTGDAEQYPQGPYGDGGGESDSPGHCDAGRRCVNAIRVPGGDPIGCPFGNPLTSDGEKSVFKAIAEDTLRLSDHARAVGRLWRKIYNHIEPDHLVKVAPDRKSSAGPGNLGELLDGMDPHADIPNHFYTDLDYVYGVAKIPPNVYVIWRVEITPEGNFSGLETVLLPDSESQERSIEDAIVEAVQADAWG